MIGGSFTLLMCWFTATIAQPPVREEFTAQRRIYNYPSLSDGARTASDVMDEFEDATTKPLALHAYKQHEEFQVPTGGSTVEYMNDITHQLDEDVTTEDTEFAKQLYSRLRDDKIDGEPADGVQAAHQVLFDQGNISADEKKQPQRVSSLAFAATVARRSSAAALNLPRIRLPVVRISNL